MAKATIEVSAVAFAVAAMTAGFVSFWAPREAVVGFGVLFLLSCLSLAAVVIKNRRALYGMPWKRVLILVVVVAALFRIAALTAPVSLSDDVWRYLWDGQMVLDGYNPYEHRPSEFIEESEEVPDYFDLLNSPQNHTVYPPLSLLSFSAALTLEELFGGSAERWLRGIFSLFDLMGIALLGLLLVRLKRPVIWAALYAWHPLVYMEVAAGGHTEALGILWMVALLGFALSGRAVATGVAIALAGLSKWTFLAIAPVVGVYLWRRRSFATAAITTVVAVSVVVLGYLPFYFSGLWENHGESIRLYSETFSFNAPLYYGLRFLLGYQEGVTESVSHITGPLLTWATIGAIAAVAWWQDGSARRLFVAVALAAGAYILFSPVFHPWYALPFLLAGALVGWTTPAVVGVVIVVSYAFYAPWMTRNGEVLLMAAQVAIVLGWILMEFGPSLIRGILRFRATKKADIISDYLDGGESILDLGCAEGYVAQELADRGHAVELVDVVDRNRTDFPITVYDGSKLLREENSVDVVVLSYVLHHSRTPDETLAEALRVGKRLIILETVYEKEWDRRLVTFLDHSANALRGMAPEPLHFDTPRGWINRIERLGAEVTAWKWIGRGVHRHIVIECQKREKPRS